MALTKIDDRGVTYPLDLLDNEKIRFGTSNDLELYHDGNNSKIINSTGNLTINAAASEVGVDIKPNGAVELFYDNVKMFATTSTGVLIDGSNTTGSEVRGDFRFKSESSGVSKVIWDGSLDMMRWQDTYKATFGTGSDLQIYHNGTSSLIDNNTGHLYIRNNVNDDDGSNIYIEAKAGEQSAIFTHDAGVELRYDNAKKFETNAGGILVTGNITTGDNNEVACGANGDLKLYHNGTNSYIDNHQGDLYIRGEDDHIVLQPVDGESAIVCDPNGSVNLYYDNFKTLHTKSNGIVLTGPESTDCNIDMYADDGDDNADFWRLVANVNGQFGLYNYASGAYEKSIFCHGDGNVELYHNNNKKLETSTYGTTLTGNLFLADSSDGNWGRIKVGTGEDLQIYHDGTNTHLNNGTGGLYIRNENIYLRGNATDEPLATFNANGSVELYNDNTKRLETNSYGSRVTGYLSESAKPIASLSHSGAIDVSDDVLDSGNCYDHTWLNQGSHFNASNGRFTCPIAGVYKIFFGATLNNENTNVRLRKNGNTINEAYSDDQDSIYHASMEATIDAAANDYLDIQVSRLKTQSGAQHKQITFQLIA